MTEEPHYVRRYNRWVPEDPAPTRTRWADRVAAANPAARWAFAIGLVLLLSALVVLAAVYAGDAAADGFGPLLPPATPTPTPYPGGWAF